MFTIVIQEKGGDQRRMVFSKPEITIGRVQGNDIVLPKGNVSKRHARIVLKDGKFIIVDLKSTNGTYVNGRKITSPLVVKDSDKIYIGDYIVGVDEAAGSDDGPSETTTSPPTSGAALADMRPPRPTEAAPQPMTGVPMGGMATPEPPLPPPSTLPPRPVGPPLRPPPQPSQNLGPSRDLGGPPRDLPTPPQYIPPVSPPGQEQRARGPGRPGGTVPPPVALPAVAPPPAAPPASALPAVAPPPVSAPAADPRFPPVSRLPDGAPAAPIPASAAHSGPIPAPSLAGPSAVVPIADKNKRASQPAAVAAPTTAAAAASRPVAVRPLSSGSRRGVALEPLDPKVVKMLDLQAGILERLRAKLDLDKIPFERLHDEDLWQRAERAIVDLVETLETSGELPKYVEQEALVKETLNEALGLGPLEYMFADEEIDEIQIDRRDRVVVGKDGVLRGSGKAFSTDDVFERVVKRLVHEAGGVIDDTRPIVDLRMPDGTRLTAAVAPVAARGACLVLKKPALNAPTLQDLVQRGALSGGMADFLATCVAARRNILVCGGPGSGKTTVLGALAGAAPAGERVVSIEEVAELAVARDEWIQLETRPAGGATPAIDMATLLDTAVRLQPDRLVIGEVRGREAMPIVQALNSSVDGALVAMTGEGASVALGRLATLLRATHPHGVDEALREMVASAFEIVVHVSRAADGSLRVSSIDEVTGLSDTSFEAAAVFSLKGGVFAATGRVPRFYAELEARGIPADQAVFR